MKPKRKRCKACNELFAPMNSLQKACSPSCAIAYSKSEEGRLNIKAMKRAEYREAKRRIKTNALLRTEAQRAFNAYIRERDKGEACISCGRDHQGQWQAGHFRSVGAAPELRFEESNCHKQCSACNNHKSGNLLEYRPRLIEKIGLERVEWLEGPHDEKKYTREQLIDLKQHYRAKLRALKNEA